MQTQPTEHTPAHTLKPVTEKSKLHVSIINAQK